MLPLDNLLTFCQDGIKPKVLLREGETRTVQAYQLQRKGRFYTCECPSWRAAGGWPETRTCRHLISLLGGAYEEARIEQLKKTAGKQRVTEDDDVRVEVRVVKKRKPTPEDEEDEDEEEEEEMPLVKDASFKPLLAHKWDLETGQDPTNWHMSEKLDGVRAIWHGSKGTFLSREGNPFYAPPWFTKRLPRGNVMLDGELFTERGGFQDCVSIVRTQNRPDRWKFSVTYQVFDCPSMKDSPFEDRYKWLKDTFEGKGKILWVNVVEHEVCKSRKHLFEKLEEVCEQKGEGLMLRQPKSYYVQGRARSLLKVKKFFDADAVVRAHEGGSGKNVGVCGALRVEMLDDNGKPTGKMFKIGTGLSDAQRRKPPKIGAVVIYRYQELSNSGNPRFPSFVGERAD
ncbi:DNA ligase/mRNA capping enzyme [Sphaerosporella brunnea]|uniref:DNA ligase/mRNA capping enzyme n=1 Tax=Sphaerosporella brunnea TaxID=1250544 RepID=A0A5J5F2E7_9PEZI|nr:DNA ligase/mRNA capping enzyme [Sphaerosporella brunnea]